VALVTGSDPWAIRREGGAIERHPIAGEFAARAELGAFAPALRAALRLDGGPGLANGAELRTALRGALDTAARPAPAPGDESEERSAPGPDLEDASEPHSRLILPIGIDPAAPEPDSPVP